MKVKLVIKRRHLPTTCCFGMCNNNKGRDEYIRNGVIEIPFDNGYVLGGNLRTRITKWLNVDGRDLSWKRWVFEEIRVDWQEIPIKNTDKILVNKNNHFVFEHGYITAYYGESFINIEMGEAINIILVD